MEKLRAELIFIAGISMMGISCLNISDMAATIFFYNGIFFCIRSIISDIKNAN